MVGGVEVTIAARCSVPNDASLARADQQLLTAVTAALQYVLSAAPAAPTAAAG